MGNNELQLHYQPKVCIANGKLIGWEALMRWQSPEFGQVSPVEFIPVAEETGLILALGQWALEETCRQVSCWRAMGLNTGSVAVNLSARQFRQRDLPEQISLLLAKHRLPASTITLEITESAIMDDPVVVAEMLNTLASKGILTAVDDFGTGHSSLSYLKNLPIHSLKIDRSFIKDIPDDENSVAIVHVILNLARSLGLFVIAEGVETQAQLNYLQQENCNAMQGYIFSRPLPAQECISLMEKYSDIRKS